MENRSHTPLRAPHPVSELALLMQSEFGDRNELAVRVVLIATGAVAYTLYDGSNLGLIWLFSYGITQVAAYTTSATAPIAYGRKRLALGVSLYLLTTAIFAAFPLYLFVAGDPATAFCGGAALAILGIFTLWRDEPPEVLLPFDIALGWVSSTALVIRFFPMMETWLAQGMAVLLSCAIAVYYTAALISSRRMKRQLREAAERGLEAQKMEALGRLSGGIAHDFNNILTVLQGNLELYQEIENPEERKKLIAEAHESSKRASGLVRQLLSFARRAPLTPRAVEADDVLEALHAMVARLLPSSIAVTTRSSHVRLPLEVDFDGLLSALLNLVINARDAMADRGEIVIGVDLVRADGALATKTGLTSGQYVAFSVSDTGPGIPQDQIEKVIEPFFTTKGVGEGSGLGLPSAKGFAEQSGGALTIQSEPGTTSVTVLVPLSPLTRTNRIATR